MNIVLFSFCLFAAAFLAHWLLWRVWLPKRQIVALLWVFQGIFAVVLLWGWLVSSGEASAKPQAAFWPCDFWQWLHVALFYEAVSLAYIVAYSALEQDSPSMTIVVFVADAKGRGRTREELYSLIGQDFITGYRFDSMVHGGLIARVGDVYVLTSRGRFWAHLFRWYRKMFRLDLGG